MSPIVRKPLFISHLTASLGWLGAVAVFVALAVIGLHSRDAATVRGAYLVMEPAGWHMLLPLAVATLLTGLVQTAALQWRLFGHYWVLFKLTMTCFITWVLLLYMNTFAAMARAASGGVLLLVVGLFAVLLVLKGPGGHGPGRHFAASLDLPTTATFNL
ncbi:MAG TPA: hypothetical protein VE085_06590 [Burkholderiales bacterium]|nr:hypothetical protein [Burkholderiales bacterium]